MADATPKQKKILHNLYHEIDFYIRAADGEGYSPAMTKDPKTFNKLVKVEREFKNEVYKYLQSFVNDRLDSFVDWSEYERRAAPNRLAAELMVKANAQAVANENKILVKVLLNFITQSQLIGGEAGSNRYKAPVNFFDLNTIVEKQAQKYSAQLVTQITESTRQSIQSSLGISIENGESRGEAAGRIADLIGSEARAETIAQTETVNSYGEGLHAFGEQSNATGHWLDPVVDDRTSLICLDLNDKYGGPDKAIPLDQPYESDYLDEPTLTPGFHVRCRTAEYLTYDPLE